MRRDGTRDVRDFTTGTGNSSGKPVQDMEPKVEQKPDFDIDLRAQGVSQDAILQDEAEMREINHQVNKVKAGSNKISVRNDLAKDGMIFREESSRAIYEVGSMELIELRQTSETAQFEGMSMCQCGKLLRPNESTLDRIRAAFEALKAPYYRTAPIISRGKKFGHNPWQQDHHRARDALKGATKKDKYTPIWDRWQRETKSIEHLVGREGRYNNVVHLRSLDSNRQAGPLCERLGYEEAARALVSLQDAEGHTVHHIPFQEKQDPPKQHNWIL